MRLASFAALAALAPAAGWAADCSGIWTIDADDVAELAADGTIRGSLLRNGSPSPLTGVRQ